MALALEESLGTNLVHWDATPRGMSIDPDVLIGKHVNAPTAVVFVTHATAERAGEKKFWRTVAEVVEAKRLDSKPRVVSVLFASNVKNNLLIAYTEMFDAAIHLDDFNWGGEFSDALTRLAKGHGAKPKETCLLVLKEKVDQKKIPGWSKFVSVLSKSLKGKHGKYHQRISSSSFKTSSRVPQARETSLRRSICKYYTFPPEVRASLKNAKRIKNAPEHAILLEWMSRGIGGYRLSDPELMRFLADAEPELIKGVVDHIDQKLPVFAEFVHSLRNVEGRMAASDWILENHARLCDPKEMRKELKNVFKDASAHLADHVSLELIPNDHWLFSSIMMMLRAETGRRDGYGYSRLGQESGFEYEISALAGTTIAPFLQRKTALESKLLEGIAKVFSEHLVRLGDDGCKQLLLTSLVTYAVSTFNFQLMNYRHYNPVDWIVCDSLLADGLQYEFPARHPSFLTAAGMGGTTSTGNLICVGEGRVWIKCQSAYAGRIDKRKELCGRIGAMKLCYTPSELEQKKFFLVLDGFFDDNDLALLDQAGWDGIFYYDELDDLAVAVAAGK